MSACRRLADITCPEWQLICQNSFAAAPRSFCTSLTRSGHLRSRNESGDRRKVRRNAISFFSESQRAQITSETAFGFLRGKRREQRIQANATATIALATRRLDCCGRCVQVPVRQPLSTARRQGLLGILGVARRARRFEISYPWMQFPMRFLHSFR
jgi:hypothetical protein